MRIDLAPFLNRQPIELMALLDDAFIREESPAEKGTELKSSVEQTSDTENDNNGFGGIDSGRDTKQRAEKVNGSDASCDVSRWEAPPDSWRFLWRYQFWHQSLLKQ